MDCWHKRRNVMLADEMGLGKTAQCVATLSHIHELGPAGPFLIVAPLSTINHWARELRAWSSLRVVVLHGSAADRALLLKRLWHAAPGPRGGERPGYFFHVVVTTYETLLLEERVLRAVPWQYLIVDEAHRLKNVESRLRVAVQGLGAQQLALLTGTPVQNSTAELFSLLNLLDPARFGDAEDFEERYGRVTDAEQVAELQGLLKPLMLRRLKGDVISADEIPAKEETIVWVELTSQQKRQARAL